MCGCPLAVANVAVAASGPGAVGWKWRMTVISLPAGTLMLPIGEVAVAVISALQAPLKLTMVISSVRSVVSGFESVTVRQEPAFGRTTVPKFTPPRHGTAGNGAHGCAPGVPSANPE